MRDFSRKTRGSLQTEILNSNKYVFNCSIIYEISCSIISYNVKSKINEIPKINHVMKRTWLAPPHTSVHHPNPLIYPTRLAASTLRFQVSSGASLSLLQLSTLESFLPYCIFRLNQGFKSANTSISQVLLLT